MKAILCNDQADFDQMNAKIVVYWNEFLCPPQGTTEKWADPKVNPINGNIWMVVDPMIYPALTQDELDRIVESNTGSGCWFQALGFDTGLGYRLDCTDGAQNAFTKKWVKESNAGTEDSAMVGIADMTGALRVLTWEQLKAIFVPYSNYCEATWIWIKQQG